MQVRILSIDGGGAKGIVPAVILQYIECKLQELSKNPNVRLSDFLDFVSGTAVGSIIAGMIITPDENGKAAYKAEEIVDNLYEFMEEVEVKGWKKLWGLNRFKYSSERVDAMHIKYFNHWKMKNLLLPTAIPSYDILNRKPVIFTNNTYDDYFLKDVITSSCASPTLIPPTKFRDGVKKHIMVAGNAIANNPALIAYIEAGKTESIICKVKKITPENTFLISLGSGQQKLKEYTFNDVKRWRKTGWFELSNSVSIQSSTIFAEYETRNLFASYNCEDNYIRIEPEIILGDQDNIMNTSRQNLLHLQQDATNYILANKDYLDDIARHLFNQDERYATMLF